MMVAKFVDDAAYRFVDKDEHNLIYHLSEQKYPLMLTFHTNGMIFPIYFVQLCAS